jgi:dihydrodipicolinate synthase/N-acetylneuraminate lyase
LKKNDQSEIGIRGETGEIYLLTKKERILAIEILKLTLATAAGRNFLVERFSKEGLKRAADLLEEMGVQISELQGRQKKNAQ